jgi:hypothetical protein
MFGIRCEEGTKEGKGPQLRKDFLRKVGDKSFLERRGGSEEFS